MTELPPQPEQNPQGETAAEPDTSRLADLLRVARGEVVDPETIENVLAEGPAGTATEGEVPVELPENTPVRQPAGLGESAIEGAAPGIRDDQRDNVQMGPEGVAYRVTPPPEVTDASVVPEGQRKLRIRSVYRRGDPRPSTSPETEDEDK